MDAFLLFFERMSDLQKVVWVMVCLGISWLLEGSFPLLQLPYRKWRHAGVNSAFLLTSLLINIAFGVASVAAVAWTASSGFGLLHWIDLPVVAEMVIALVVFDFTAQYVAHYLLHRVKWMWRLHVVHHNDTKVDATTGARLHPGDYALREAFALATLLLIGAPLAFYVLYRIVTIFFTFVTHANVSPPAWLDAALSWVFVTPNMHKFHHHFERPWTDTNFGGVLSIWDRMFGTFVYGDPHDVIYGLDVSDTTRDEDVAYLFKVPFTKKERLTRE